MSWLMILILALIIIIGIAALPIFKANQDEYRRTGKRPKGYYMSWGMAVGLAIGLPLGIAMDNVVLGPAMGLPIGVAIGAALEKKHEDELRPRTEKEEKMQRVAMIGLAALLIVGLFAFAATFFIASR